MSGYEKGHICSTFVQMNKGATELFEAYINLSFRRRRNRTGLLRLCDFSLRRNDKQYKKMVTFQPLKFQNRNHHTNEDFSCHR
jgi:hypothetical protein